MIAVTTDVATTEGEMVIPSNPYAGKTRLPDISYIKSSVPIAEVAGLLGLEVIGNMIRCWRTENHQHGDRTPSVASSESITGSVASSVMHARILPSISC